MRLHPFHQHSNEGNVDWPLKVCQRTNLEINLLLTELQSVLEKRVPEQKMATSSEWTQP